MAGITVDTSELRTYSATLQAAGKEVSSGLEAVVKKGATNVKTQQVTEMSQGITGPKVARTISYDITAGPSYVEAEIGPTKGGAGSLANLMYFGSWKGGGQIPDPEGALQAEAPRFAQALSDLMAKAVT